MTRLQRLERECSKLWQEAESKLWRGRCARCKRWCPDLDGAAHHIIRRRVHATKFELMNGIYLCTANCHPQADQNPDQFMDYLQEYWPPLWTWHVQHRNPDPVRFTEAFLLETRTRLKQVVKELG